MWSNANCHFSALSFLEGVTADAACGIGDELDVSRKGTLGRGFKMIQDASIGSST